MPGRGLIEVDAWARKGNLDSPVGDLSEAIKLDSNLALVFLIRGRIYFNKNDPTRALKDMDEAIRLDPKNAVSYLMRAEISYKTQAWEKALRDYLKVHSYSIQKT